MEEASYICSIHILNIIDAALLYWELDSKNWVIINNNLATHLDELNVQSSLCVYTYPHEDGPRINYIKQTIIKSAWINEDKTNATNPYFLTPRTI